MRIPAIHLVAALSLVWVGSGCTMRVTKTAIVIGPSRESKSAPGARAAAAKPPPPPPRPRAAVTPPRPNKPAAPASPGKLAGAKPAAKPAKPTPEPAPPALPDYEPPVQPLADTVEFHVATAGDDTNPGTESAPFRTLPQAQQAVREFNAAGRKANVRVLIHSGRYELTEPLTFGAPDGGTRRQSITYAAQPGATVVISGGRRITDWEPHAGKIWKSQLTGPAWEFRNLYTANGRAIRARTPNSNGSFRLQDATISPALWTLTPGVGDIQAWSNPSEMEAVFFGIWTINRKRLEQITPSGVIELAQPHVKFKTNLNAPKKGTAYFLENALELVDSNREWYLDRRQRRVYFWADDGATLAQEEITAPVLPQVVIVRGADRQPVRNLHFRGLQLAHTDWSLPEPGYTGVQAGFYTASNVTPGLRHESGLAWYWQFTSTPRALLELEFAQDCSFTDGTLAHSGGTGIRLARGTQRNRIAGNRIHDIAGTGVMVGEPVGGSRAEEVVGNRVLNNTIQDCGAVFYDAVGVWVGMARGTVIAHNEIQDLPYTGISVGWQWNSTPTACQGNQIESNHVHDVMKRLHDGAGIYTLGFQPGTVIRGNLVHDVRDSRATKNTASSTHGFYFDEGSRGFTVESNIVYRVGQQAITYHRSHATAHTLRGNLFSTRTVPGRDGNALALDGSIHGSFLDVPHHETLEAAHLTVQAWVNLDEIPRAPYARHLLVGKNRQGMAGHYGLVLDGANVSAQLNFERNLAGLQAVETTDAPLHAGRWHLLALTYDGADLQLFVDGESVATRALNRPRVAGTEWLRIGKAHEGGRGLRGMLDEVRIYNRAKTAAELRADYQRAGPLPADATAGLVGYWDFEDLAELYHSIHTTAGLEPAYRKQLPSSTVPAPPAAVAPDAMEPDTATEPDPKPDENPRDAETEAP